ncbi:hypothetical protein [Amycolatopsis sp. NPDC059657]|uniref:hypothetical protein n=1 Tax=Amycolatopsis sp. NPDC059657 TaxID=3346899 RepID=UPI00366A6D74
MTYPDPDPRYPGTPGYQEPVAERAEIVERPSGRITFIRVLSAVIDLICVLFALVLGIHIVLVLGSANTGNGFAQLIEDWSKGVSLGLRNLFTPDSFKVRILLNDGLAAVLWLIIGGVLTSLLSRIALPTNYRRTWYHRRVTP